MGGENLKLGYEVDGVVYSDEPDKRFIYSVDEDGFLMLNGEYETDDDDERVKYAGITTLEALGYQYLPMYKPSGSVREPNMQGPKPEEVQIIQFDEIVEVLKVGGQQVILATPDGEVTTQDPEIFHTPVLKNVEGLEGPEDVVAAVRRQIEENYYGCWLSYEIDYQTQEMNLSIGTVLALYRAGISTSKGRLALLHSRRQIAAGILGGRYGHKRERPPIPWVKENECCQSDKLQGLLDTLIYSRVYADFGTTAEKAYEDA